MSQWKSLPQYSIQISPKNLPFLQKWLFPLNLTESIAAIGSFKKLAFPTG